MFSFRRTGLTGLGANVSVPERYRDAGSSPSLQRRDAGNFQLGAYSCEDETTVLPGSAGRILGISAEHEPHYTEANARDAIHQIAFARVRDPQITN